LKAHAAPPPTTDPGHGITSDALVAVAALTTMRPGIPHISSVATLGAWRGRGLARDLCARLTRQALAPGVPAVTLGMHAGNGSARNVYRSLGYEVGYRWASGRVPVHADRSGNSLTA
jgi:predicted GNAT family acetyltransferase